MAPAAGSKLKLALVAVRLPTTRLVAARQGGKGVVKVTLTAPEVWALAQFVVTVAVYVVPGVRPDRLTGEAVAVLVTVAPPAGVTATV